MTPLLQVMAGGGNSGILRNIQALSNPKNPSQNSHCSRRGFALISHFKALGLLCSWSELSRKRKECSPVDWDFQSLTVLQEKNLFHNKTPSQRKWGLPRGCSSPDTAETQAGQELRGSNSPIPQFLLRIPVLRKLGMYGRLGSALQRGMALPAALLGFLFFPLVFPFFPIYWLPFPPFSPFFPLSLLSCFPFSLLFPFVPFILFISPFHFPFFLFSVSFPFISPPWVPFIFPSLLLSFFLLSFAISFLFSLLFSLSPLLPFCFYSFFGLFLPLSPLHFPLPFISLFSLIFSFYFPLSSFFHFIFSSYFPFHFPYPFLILLFPFILPIFLFFPFSF